MATEIIIEDIDQTTQHPGWIGDDAFIAFGKTKRNFDTIKPYLEQLGVAVDTVEQAVADAEAAIAATVSQGQTSINGSVSAGNTSITNSVNAGKADVDAKVLAANNAINAAVTAGNAAVDAKVLAANNAFDAQIAGLPARVDTLINGRINGKNVLINGNHYFAQRGPNRSVIDTGYNPQYHCVDRWYMASAGTLMAMSQQIFPAGQTAVPGNPSYFLRVGSITNNAAASLAYTGQTVEDVRTFSGKASTLSFWAKASSARKLGVSTVQHFGSGGSSDANQVWPVLNLTTAWQLFTVAITLPSVAGKVIGANNHVRLRLWIDAGASYTGVAGAVGSQSGDFDIALVKWEDGTVATGFEFEQPSEILSQCQRYYRKSYSYGTLPGTPNSDPGRISFSINYGTPTFNAYGLRFDGAMRVPPAVTVYSAVSGVANKVTQSDNSDVTGTVTVRGINESGAEVNWSNNGAGNFGGWFHYTADAEI